ncbi:hypothetical protein BDZ90DRAFT_229695 [Jaminaea rosea]|uniref:Uncharacterized protein n=1 Tax=Jaminaea rosea TaxID=1569628 RepID=A0A316UZG4_9BASI|nr:hypothetical protein BDZ90DRAFT_229695 [Jaminaea rosea]PWN30689.1 hypothetical protein BDZ90DRAFT_229695 [Jaminaea rosea]
MTIFESMEGRKWKQRCSTCGTPMGSWNEAKRRWSIWPSSLARSYQPEGDGASSPEGAIHPSILAAIRADHHQFYGPWRLMNINDDLPKWDGYKEQSQRVP